MKILKSGDTNVRARPVLLLTGQSGSGKTHSLGMLADAGKRVAVIDMEGKTEQIQKYGPTIVTVDEGLADLRKLLPTVETKQWGIGCADTREKLGLPRDLDIICIDSLMEVGNLLYTETKLEYPSKGGDGSYTRWEEYGIRLLGFASACRDLASAKVPDPVGVIVTAGTDDLNNLVVKGRMTHREVAFKFSWVFRLTSALVDGEAVWTLQTAGAGLKTPGTDVIPAQITLTKTGFVRVWETLEQQCLA